MIRVISYYNNYGLGDCIFHAHYLRKMSELHPGIEWKFYVKTQHIGEVKSFLDGRQFSVLPIEAKSGNAIDSWIARHGTHDAVIASDLYKRSNELYLEHYYRLAFELNLESAFTKIEDCLIDHPKILEPTAMSGELDYLIINSNGLSGQFPHEEKEFVSIVESLKNKGLRIITTKRTGIPYYPCTLDFGLNLLQIASLSLQAKKVIAVNTSPVICCLNKWAIKTVEKWFILSNCQTYTYNDRFIQCKNLTELSEKLC